MCRWLSYIGDPVYLDKLVFEPRHSLVEQSLHAEQAKTPTNGDGFGIGWYDERQTPGLYREILPAWNDPNLRSLAHHIKSGLFLPMCAPPPERTPAAPTATRFPMTSICSCITARLVTIRWCADHLK